MSPVHLICCEITLMAGKLTGCGTMLPMSTNLPPSRTMSSPSTVAAAMPTTSTTTSAQRLLVDRDDLRRAFLGGDGGRVDAETARALDGDHVAELHARVLEAVEHLAHGAVHRR